MPNIMKTSSIIRRAFHGQGKKYNNLFGFLLALKRCMYTKSIFLHSFSDPLIYPLDLRVAPSILTRFIELRASVMRWL
jgi:hypothetical protein